MSQVYVGNSSEVNPPPPVTDLHVARYIVSAGGTTDGANYTTIAAAYAAAVAAGGSQTVAIQPGTYTENITLSAGINLTAFTCDAGAFIGDGGTANVTIIGKLSASYSDSCWITGINLQTNNDYCISQTGSNVTDLFFKDCNINASNHTAIQSTVSTDSRLYFYNCTADTETTGITYFNSSGAADLRFYGGEWSNDGLSITASTLSGTDDATLFMESCRFFLPITTSGSSGITELFSSEFYSEIIVGGSAGGYISNCRINSGSSIAVSVGTGATLYLTECDINSSATNVITGSGTLIYGGVTFSGSSSGISTSSVTPIPWPVQQGGTGLISATGVLFGQGNTFSPIVPLWYGDGSDGEQTFDGTTTILGLVPSNSTYILTRDIVLESSTINNGVTIASNGFKILCNGTLTNNGKISANGNNGTAGASGGAGGTAFSLSVGQNAQGGLGEPGNGSGGSSTSASIGGAGGAEGAGGTGSAGPAGTATAPVATQGTYHTLFTFQTGFSSSVIALKAGAGGGGGGGDGSKRGGGGGAGGAGILIVAYQIVGTGSISSNGGNGANGDPAGSGGGGGGGGGGFILICSLSSSSNSIPGQTLTVNSGSFGSHSGSGSDGNAGSVGTILCVVG